MAWIMICQSHGCSGRYRQFFGHKKLSDAIKQFQENHKILGADIHQWTAVPLQDVIDVMKHAKYESSCINRVKRESIHPSVKKRY